MLQIDLDTLTRTLLKEIKYKEQLFDFGMRNNKEFDEMKKLHLEIKELRNRLNMLSDKSNQLQNSNRSVGG